MPAVTKLGLGGWPTGALGTSQEVSASFGGAHEAVAPAARAAASGHEALAVLGLADAGAHEAGKGVALQEAPVHETLATALLDPVGAHESLAALDLDEAGAHEAGDGIARAESGAHEGVGGLLSPLAVPHESTQSLVAAQDGSHESTEGVVRTHATPHEAEGSAGSVSADRPGVHESTQPAAAVAAGTVESVQGSESASAGPHESVAAVAKTVAGSQEATEGVSREETPPYEAEGAAGSVAATHLAPHEATGAVQEEAAGVHESGQPVQQGADGVHESGLGVAATAESPQEAAGEVRAAETGTHEVAGQVAASEAGAHESTLHAEAARAGAHEAGLGAAAASQPAWEATGRVAVGPSTPHEATSVVILVSASFAVPVEAVARAVAALLVPHEAEGVLLDIRERILRNVEATLQSIAIANGFDHDVAVVLRYDDVGFQLDAYPAILVRESHTDEEQTEKGDSALQEAVIELEFGLWVREEEAPPELANAFLLDVQRALMVDPTRGGLAVDTVERGSALIATEAMAPFAYQTARFSVPFRHDHDDPYKQGGVAGGGYGAFPTVVGAKANALSARERAVRDLVAALQAISRVNGYQNDVAAVERVLEVPARIPAFPVVFVQETQEVKVEGVGVPVGLVRGDLSLTLFVWAREDLAAALPGEVNELLADVKRALRVDVTRGGVAVMTQVRSTVQEVDDVGTPLGLHRVETLVRYRHARPDPSAAR